VIYDARRTAVARDGDLLTNVSGDPEWPDGTLPTIFSFNGIDYPCE
jgi:hypothetical protein